LVFNMFVWNNVYITAVSISYSLGMIRVVIFDYVLKSDLFNRIRVVWYLTCLFGIMYMLRLL